MQFTTLLTVALASLAAAAPDFAIGPGYTSRFTAKDQAQLASMTKAILDAASSFQASVTAKPEYSSALSQLRDFQETHSGVPAAVTATDTIIEFSTTPEWYGAMPTDLRAYIEKNRKENEEALKSIIESATKGDAARPVSMGIYVSGAIAAVVAGVAVAL